MQQPPDPYGYPPPPPYPTPQHFPQQPYSQPYAPQQPYNSQPYTPPAYAQPMLTAPDPMAGRRRRIAFSRGLIFGLVMGLAVALWVAYGILPQIPAIVPAGPMVSLLQALPVWVIYYFAGRSGARAGEKTGTGIATCLWATLWYLLIDLIGFIVLGVYFHEVPTFGGFGLDITLALIGVGIGALGASKGAPRTPVPPYNAPFGTR